MRRPSNTLSSAESEASEKDEVTVRCRYSSGQPTPRGSGSGETDRLTMTPSLDESAPRFFVAASTLPGARRGLFARVALAAGDVLPVVRPGAAGDGLFFCYSDDAQERF